MQAYTLENFPTFIGDYTLQQNGHVYRVSIKFDDIARPEDYGLVTRVGRRQDKHPGELLLKLGVFFNFSACCELARKEAWGYRGYNPESSEETPRQIAAKAAREVFENLRAWYHDEWCYVGITVQDSRGAYIDSLWGIEDDGTDYIREIVQEIIHGAEAGRKLQEAHQNFLIDSRGV